MDNSKYLFKKYSAGTLSSFPLYPLCMYLALLTYERPCVYNAAFLAWSVWHWIVMQWISYLTLANVGSMLCAAASDPFTGPDYRLVAIVHQSLAIFLFGSLTASLCPQAQRGKLVGTNASSSNSKED